MSQSGNPGWHEKQRESSDIPPFSVECSKMLHGIESKHQHKPSKENKNRKKT
jgi:hypothetical protein